MNKGHWQYHSHIDTDEYFGFIYKISNMLNGKLYIGKKSFRHAVTKPPLKGRKNKRRSTKDSGWKAYTGSSKALNKDIETHGISNFRFEILGLCKTRMELRYEEVKTQWACLVLEARMPNGDYKYYNGAIDSVRGKKK